MHITIWLNGDQKYLKTPTANLHLFQSLLYALLPPECAAFLHDEGFPVEGRRMKLFAMSWPIAAHPPIFEKKHILFPLPVRLVVSTPVMPTLDGFATGALGAGPLRVGHNAVRCERVEAVQQTAEGETLTVRTLSHHLLRPGGAQRKTLHHLFFPVPKRLWRLRCQQPGAQVPRAPPGPRAPGRGAARDAPGPPPREGGGLQRRGQFSDQGLVRPLPPDGPDGALAAGARLRPGG